MSPFTKHTTNKWSKETAPGQGYKTGLLPIPTCKIAKSFCFLPNVQEYSAVDTHVSSNYYLNYMLIDTQGKMQVHLHPPRRWTLIKIELVYQFSTD